MDGYEFLQKVRQEPRFAHVIVIIITSDESDETKAKLLRGGANDFVHKGDSHDEIIACIRVHLSAQAAQADRKVLAWLVNWPIISASRCLCWSRALMCLRRKDPYRSYRGQQGRFLKASEYP